MKVRYPYLHPKGTIAYISASSEYMRAAKETARLHSLDKIMPTGTVLVQKGKIIGRGANGSLYHELNGCERVRQNIPTGENYELCEGCSPKNHSEPRAVLDAMQAKQNISGAEAYLWGHWWCCDSCWQTMIENGVTKVYLLQNSQELFNKEAAKNVVGRQFA